MIRGDRIIELLDQRRISQAELARRIGISQNAMWKIITGKTVESAKIHLIARELETSVDFLIGEGPALRSPVDFVTIREVGVSFGMGGGLFLAEDAEAKLIPIPRDWLRDRVAGNFDQVCAVRGDGDSMEPTIRDGDIVIFDTAQNALTAQEKIYAFGYGELGMIKRLRQLPDGALRVMSDNPSVEAFNAYDGEVQIFGRVIFIGRRM